MSQRWESNPQPQLYESCALPIELRWLNLQTIRHLSSCGCNGLQTNADLHTSKPIKLSEQPQPAKPLKITSHDGVYAIFLEYCLEGKKR